MKAKLICSFLSRRHRWETQEVLICNTDTCKESFYNMFPSQWDCLVKAYFLLLNVLQSQDNQLSFYRRNFQACKWCKWHGQWYCTKSRWFWSINHQRVNCSSNFLYQKKEIEDGHIFRKISRPLEDRISCGLVIQNAHKFPCFKSNSTC